MRARFNTLKRPWRAPPARVFCVCVLFVVSPGCHDTGAASRPAPSYAEARALVDRHCVSCHSERPTIPAFPIAPGAVSLDTAEQMQRHAERVMARTIDGTMPLLNKTGMTERERRILRRWVEAGAKGP